MTSSKQDWAIYLIFSVFLVLQISATFSTTQLSYSESYSNIVKAIDKSSGVHQGFYLFLKGVIFLLNSLKISQATQIVILKCLSIILSGIILFLAYSLIIRVSNDNKKSFFALILLVTSPVIYLMTANTLFTESFVLILILATLNSWINSINNKKTTFDLIILSSILIISSPLSAFFIIVIYVYLLLHLLEFKKILSFEREIAIYSTFLYAAYYIFFFRDYLLNKNLALIIQEFLSPIYSSLTQINISYLPQLVGPTTILFGIYAIYSELTNIKKSKKIFYMLTALIIVSFSFTVLRISNVYFLLSVLAISLSIASARAITALNSFFMKSRFSNKAKNAFLTAAILLNISFAAIFLPQAIITNISNSIPEDIVKFLNAIDNNYNESIRIISCEETSPLIEFYTKHNSVYEDLKAEDKEELIQIYNSPLEIRIIEMLKKYNAKCIMLTDFEREMFNTDSLKAVDLDLIRLKLNISNNLLYCMEK